jgi:ABC-type proline/glycine betaine transport system permease subunit
MSSANRLRLFAASVLVLNVLATVAAIAINLPSQFGMVGTDAASEFLTSGTAISAPVPPVALLLLVVGMAGRRGLWGWVGIVAAYVAAVAVGIGGVGEMLADPTEDTPRSVLVAAGAIWLMIAAALAILATVVVSRRSSATSQFSAT